MTPIVTIHSANVRPASTYEADLAAVKRVLPDEKAVGSMLNTAINSDVQSWYSYEEYPNFIKQAIGTPSLHALSSLHPHNEALAEVEKTNSGLGQVFNVTHAEMRRLGHDIGEFIFPGIKDAATQGLKTGNSLAGYYQQVEAHYKGIDIGLSKPYKPDMFLMKKIAKLAGMAVATHIFREQGNNDEAFIKDINTAHELYGSMLDILSDLQRQIQNAADSEGKNKNFAENLLLQHKLKLNLEAIQKVTAKNRPSLKTLRILLAKGKVHELPRYFSQLFWDSDELPGGKYNPDIVTIANPRDAASVLYHLNETQECPAYMNDLCDRIAAAANDKAVAKILRTNMNKIKTLTERIMSGDNIAYRAGAEALNEYCERILSRPVDDALRTSPSSSRSSLARSQ